MRVAQALNTDIPHVRHTPEDTRRYGVRFMDHEGIKPFEFSYKESPVNQYIFEGGLAVSGSSQNAMWGIAKDGKYYWRDFSKFNQQATTDSKFWDSFDPQFDLKLDDKRVQKFGNPVNLWFNLGLYWHWFCEDYPLIKFFRQNHHPIITNLLHDWQWESLNFCPDIKERIIEYPTPVVIDAPEYHCYTYPATSFRGKSAQWVGQFLQDTIKVSHKRTPTQLTYIGRKDAVARRVENEDEVKALLKEYDFKVYDEFSHLTMKQKANVFAKSKLVVSSTGANLTHCHAMQPGSKVIDFNHAFELTEECGWNNIGASVGVDWMTIPAHTSQADNDRSRAGGVKMKNRGLIVDIGLLRQAIEHALSEGTERS